MRLSSILRTIIVLIVLLNGSSRLSAATLPQPDILKETCLSHDKIHTIHSIDEDGSRPLHLHLACETLNKGLCMRLLTDGADVTSKDHKGNTPLHTVVIAVSSPVSWDGITYNQEQICRLLMKYGANSEAKNFAGNTPLHLAVLINNKRIASFLLDKNANKNEANDLLQTPLHCAFLRPKDFEEDQALGLFERYGTSRALITKLLLLYRARHTATDIFGNMPLHYCCLYPHEADNALEYFKEADVDMSTANTAGWSPIHLASFSNNVEAMQNLLLYGVDINVAIPSSGKTALMIACELGYDTMCSLLLVSSLDKDARDTTVGTALDWAWEFEHVDLCKKLLKAGFDKQSERNKVLLARRAVQKENKKLIELFFTTWKRWNSIDEKGNTILHYACKEGFSDVVEILFRFLGTNNLGPLLRNKKGKTARAIALAKGDKEIELVLSQHRVTR